jgi:hypothetical protein
MRTIAVAILCLLPFQLFSQEQSLYSFDYEGVELETVLQDLHLRYGLLFTYSDDKILLDMPIHAKNESSSLEETLDVLFLETGVLYVIVGEQVVLQWDESARLERTSSEPLAQQIRLIERLSKIPSREPRPLPAYDREEKVKIQVPLPEVEVERDPDRISQLSVLPFVGTNGLESDEITNRLSVNILAGYNGGVNGTEVAGLLNVLRRDMKGVQWSGVGNLVQGQMLGTQISLLGVNTNIGKVQGLQIAGTANIVFDDMTGLQLAGFGNVGFGNIRGWQAAAGFNLAQGDVYAQAAGLVNWSGGSVGGSQLALLFNKADWVGGDQVGLINVCDSIGGVPFGLISFVRKGYRRLELSFSEDLHINLGAKIGTRKFYSIFQFGSRADELSWGFGYGFGTSITMGRQSWLSAELVGMHVNEKEWWTNELNMLFQTRVALDINLKDGQSLFFGPELKVLFSKRESEEGELIGSGIMPYSFSDKSTDAVNTRMWIGGRLGIRL